MDIKEMGIKELAKRTYEDIQMRKKNKEYARRALECDVTSIGIRGYERTSRRKVGQFTRR